MGLPTCWGKKGNPVSFEYYRPSLFKSRENIDKFQDMSGALKGQTIVDSWINYFYLLWKNKNVFSTTSTYDKYIELDIAYRIMITCKYHVDEDWKVLVQFAQEWLIKTTWREKKICKNQLEGMLLSNFYYYIVKDYFWMSSL